MAIPEQPRLTAREKRWRAEDDARTIATSKVIIDDPARLELAKKAAVRIAQQEKKSAEAMDDVSNVKKGAPISANSKGPQRRQKRKTTPKPSYNVFQKVGGK